MLCQQSNENGDGKSGREYQRQPIPLPLPNMVVPTLTSQYQKLLHHHFRVKKKKGSKILRFATL